MKKNISLLIGIVLMSFLLSVVTFAAVFVSDSGSDSAAGTSASAPLKTLSAAYEKLGGSGTVVVCGPLTVSGEELYFPSSSGKVVITSEYSSVNYASTKNAVLNLKGYTYLAGDTEFNNITLHDASSYYYNYIVCNGHSLTIGSGVTTTVDSGVDFTIIGGTIVSDSDTVEGVSFSDYTITVKSGRWYMINGSNKRTGSKNPMGVTGNVSVVISGGTFLAETTNNSDAMISVGGYASQEGDYNLEISGGTFSMPICAIARPGNNTSRYTAYYEGDVRIKITGGTFNGGKITTVQSEAASYIGGNYTLEITGGTFAKTSIIAPRVRGTAACKVISSLSSSVSGFDKVGDVSVNNKVDKTPDLTAPNGVVFVGGDVSGSGSNAKTPLTSITDAVEYLGEGGGTVVVCKPLSIEEDELGTYEKITVTSVYSGYDFRTLCNAKIKMYGTLSLGGETVFEHVTFENREFETTIYCNNYKTVFGDGIVSLAHVDGGINNYPSIYAGTRILAGSPSALGKSALDITFKSGKWDTLYFGNRRIHGGSYTLRAISGESVLNISGGEFHGDIYLTGMNSHSGNITMNVTGGKLLCSIFGMAIPVTVDDDVSTVNGDIIININSGELHGDIRPVQSYEKNTINGCYTININGGDLRAVGSIVGVSGVSGNCTSKIVSVTDLSKESTGSITYTNPMIDYGADPSVCYYDGWYYYASLTTVNSLPAIQVSRAANVCDIGNTLSTVIYCVTDENIASIWAPQIYMLDGNWYVYFSGAAAENASVQRTPYVLKSDTSDPFGTYTMIGVMQNLDSSIYSWLSPRVFEYGGARYYISSVFETAADNSSSSHFQTLAIGKLSSPTCFEGNVSIIAEPTLDFEAKEIMEGPYPVYGSNGTLYIAYAANYANSNDYCTGLLKLVGSNLTSASSWQKLSTPMQQRDSENEVFAPGATVFVPSADGSEVYAVYHAKLHADNEYNRSMFVQKLEYKNTVPYLGAPPSLSSALTLKANPISVADRIEGFETLTLVGKETDEGVEIHFNPVEGATAYIIRRNGKLLTSGIKYSVQDTGLSPGPYTYRVQAVKSGSIVADVSIRVVVFNTLRYKDLDSDGDIDIHDAIILLKSVLNGTNTEATMKDVLQMFKCIV